MLSNRTLDILIEHHVPYLEMDEEEIIEVLTAIVEIEKVRTK